MIPAERVARIEAEATGRDLSSWEKHSFLPNIRQRKTLSERQEEILREIETKVFGEGDDVSP